MKQKINWGILGTGKIAKVFAEDLKSIPDANLVAVGSRSEKTGKQFGKLFNIPNIHSSYAELASDPEVDVIYISTPHNLHAENSILCLKNGKSVLCEKPFTVNAKEAREVVQVAKKNKLFLMEAMWARFLPMAAEIRRLLKEGILGEIKIFTGDFGFCTEWNPENRTLNPSLAGGALLDVGVYPIAYASMIFQQAPTQIVSLAQIGPTNVDEQSAMIFKYDKGQLAILYCAVRTNTPKEAFIIGSKGFIKLFSPFWRVTKALITIGDKESELNVNIKGNGYNYQALETMNCIRQGKLESDLMTLEESISIMETMDEIRSQWGLKYPME